VSELVHILASVVQGSGHNYCDFVRTL